MSQRKLAQALAITVGELAAYERGELRIDATLLDRAAQLLAVPMSYFFEAHDKAHRHDA